MGSSQGRKGVTELAALGRTVRGAWRRGQGAGEEEVVVVGVNKYFFLYSF